MECIDFLLFRLREANDEFLQLAPDLWDARLLQSQIELRKRALNEIEAIRFYLRPVGSENGNSPRGQRSISSRRTRSPRIGRNLGTARSGLN